MSRIRRNGKIYKETLTAHQFWLDVYNFLQQEEPPEGWYRNGKSAPMGSRFCCYSNQGMYGLKNVEVNSAFGNNIFFKYGLSLLDSNSDSENS